MRRFVLACLMLAPWRPACHLPVPAVCRPAANSLPCHAVVALLPRLVLPPCRTRQAAVVTARASYND